MKEVFKRSLVKIEQRENVYFLTMSYKMNILTYELMKQLNEAYDFLENETQDAACLVTLSDIPKVFSAGFDLKYMLKHKGTQKVEEYRRVNKLLLSKLLQLPMITIAAINGHSYAAGLAFALCHDYKIMNKDFGKLCMSEIKYGLSINPGISSVCKHKISPEYYKYMVLTGEPITPQEGIKAKIIEEVVPLDKLKERAFEMGQKLAAPAKHRYALKKIKTDMNKNMIDVLEDRIPSKSAIVPKL